ncbi:RNA polymerase subunit sigma-24 [Burkholderiales bacterium 8X]|nr:RNA polymerase subunit sigma-24 [Burkholderiales bacterium 8X]
MPASPTDLFQASRKRLQRIAYRMLGSTEEAEEVVQDVWLRWHEIHDPAAAFDKPEAWLVTTTTRLAIDRLRMAKVRREQYPGLWLPEPQLSDSPPTPEQVLGRADDISMAFLFMLERLAPEARAAFLMREVFDADYDEVASVIGKSEAACRQLVHRAKKQLREAEGPRQTVTPETHRRVMERFVAAMQTGDIAGLKSMLAPEAELLGDGGGKVPSFGKPLEGAQRIAQLFFASALRYGERQKIQLAVINETWGVLRFIDGVLESAQAFEMAGDRIVRIHVQRNPDKLARVGAAWRVMEEARVGPGKT